MYSAIGLRAEPQTDSGLEFIKPNLTLTLNKEHHVCGEHVEHLQQNIWTR